MSNTGVQVDQSVVGKFNEFKLKKSNKYLIFKLSDDKSKIVVEHEGATDASYDEFTSKFPPNDCRYGVSLIEYVHEDGGPREKLVFFMWAPDSAPMKSKMIYAGTKDSVKKALVGVQVEVQGTDASEVTFEEAVSKCKALK